VRHRQADRASERYDAVRRELTAQRAKVRRLESELAEAAVRVHGGREEAGALARSQYRGTVVGMPPLLVLLLSGRPRAALAQDHALTHAVADRTAAVKRLTGAERRRDALAGKAREAMRRQQKLTHRRKTRRDELRRRLREVEELLVGPPGRAASRPGGTDQAGATDPR
jgi:hypothetical protein